MSPLRWIHGTISHWTVILDDESLDVLTESGGADGAGVKMSSSTYASGEILHTYW